jgi:fucose 4-O-acetylase-like acetyltransferase
VLGHTIQISAPNFDENLFFRLIYSLHMPLFMFISGCVAYISLGNKSSLSVIRKKFMQLMVPFLVWAIVAGYFLSGRYHEMDFLSFMNKLLLSPDMGLWFLWILFFSYLILLVVRKADKLTEKFKPYNSILIYLTLILINILTSRIQTNKFAVYLVLWYMLFFVGGYYIFKYKNFYIKYFNFAIEAAIPLFLILFIFWDRVKPPAFISIIDKYISNSVLDYIIDTAFDFVVAMCGIIIVFSIIRMIKNFKISHYLDLLGRYTFDIYVIHQSIFFFFFLGFFKQDMLITQVIVAALVICAALVISFVFLRPSRILRKLFLGMD